MLIIISLATITLSSCDMFNGLIGENNSEENFDEELKSSTGKWLLLDDEDTYFIFDGSKNVMSFTYFEDGISKFNGTYRVVFKGLGEKVINPLTFIITRSDKDKEDWLGCYVDDFTSEFTQFTIMVEEEDLGMISGNFYTHIYRISELPYKKGTYVLEGNAYKNEANNYMCADYPYIPSGTYSLETGESFTFSTIKPALSELFQYSNGNTIIEGTYVMAEDKKTIYLYIEHDPYSKITKEDEDKYDVTFSMYYPPDFYLRGDFTNEEYILITDLYHHTYSLTTIEDSTWVFGEYSKSDNRG